MEYNYSVEQMIGFIKEYVNDKELTWSGLVKKHLLPISVSTFLKNMYHVVQNPNYVSDRLFFNLREKSIYISTIYHPEGTQRIIKKFTKLYIIRRNMAPNVLENLQNIRSQLSFQISSYDSYFCNDTVLKSELEDELKKIELQIELAKRYG